MNMFEGRWDVVVHHPDGDHPTWFEITGNTGRFVGQVGSARPISTVQVDGNRLEFSLPPQYEQRKDDLRFEGALKGEILRGTTTISDGRSAEWTAKRAPELPRRDVTWGEPVDLLAKGLDSWTLRSPKWVSNWSMQDGQLVNSAVGSDLITVGRFSDFKLVVEHKYPKGSNSGIYLRGRYEVQIVDDFGKGTSVGSTGAVYGFIEPREQAVLAPGEWQRYEITFIGRWVTIVLNGKTVVDNQEIPGITGGALDSDEGEPGPLFLQGDHGPITFRKVELTPAR